MDINKVEAQARGVHGLFRLEWHNLGTSITLKIKDSMDRELITLARSKDKLEDPKVLFDTAKQNLKVLEEAVEDLRKKLYD